MAPAKSFRPMLWSLKKGIPDPGDIGLGARSGGDVRAGGFAAAEQVLRVLTSFPAGSVRAGIYFDYDPARRREQRTQIRLAAFCRDEKDTATREALRLLFRSGPLQSVYGGLLAEEKPADDWLPVDAYTACHRILRREELEGVRPARRDHNHRLRGLEAYYAVHPFKPREDNDWLGLDRLLDQMEHPALVEVLVGPAPLTSLAGAQGDYLYWLTQINAVESPMDRHIAEEARRRLLTTLQQDPTAEKFVKWNEELAESLRQPQLIFGLRCWSVCPVEGQLLASIVAEECFTEGSYGIEALSADAASLERVRRASRQMGILPPAAKTLFDGAAGDAVGPDHAKALALLPMTCPPEQLKSVLRLPVARSAASPRTLFLHTDPAPSKRDTWSREGPTQDTSLLIGEDLEVGPASLDEKALSIVDDLDFLFREPDARRAEIRLERKLLQKHLFVCGVPGSGKTTAMFNFVAQLYYQKTPFLIIEPAKTEYRMFKKFRDHPSPEMRQLATDLRVYTIGEERVSPLRFNPMIPGEDVSIEEHTGALMACFKASMPIDGPLEGILKEALGEVFAAPPQNRQPRISDLLAAALRILRAKGYDEEITSNLRAALEVRLGFLTKGSLGKVLECDENVPERDQLFTSPVVLEMDLLSQQDACLMTLLVLTALRQYLRAHSRSGAPLKHVVFLEEAHNIAGRTGEGGGEGADPRKHAAEYIARMLAEVRALGEGMIIADQLPSAVAPEVVKNTGAKLALRLVANDDREELGGTMLLDQSGIAELARLSVGQGFFYREGYYRPRRVQTLNSHAILSATTLAGTNDAGESVRLKAEFEPPDRRELTELIAVDPWFVKEMCEREVLAAAKQILEAGEVLIHHAADIKAGCDRLVAARNDIHKSYYDEPLRAAAADLRELRDAASESAGALVLEMDELLRRFGAESAAAARYPKLVDTVDAVFEEMLRPLVGRLTAADAFLQTAEVLLGEREAEATAVEPLWQTATAEAGGKSLTRDSAALLKTFWSRHLTRAERLISELFADFDSWPRPPDLPEVPEDPTQDEVVSLGEECQRGLADGFQRTDRIAFDLLAASVVLAYFSKDLNPIVSTLDPKMKEIQEDIEKIEEFISVGRSMLALWWEQLSFCKQLGSQIDAVLTTKPDESPAE